jgi:hypothetical protein
MTKAQKSYLEEVLSTQPTPKRQTLKAALNTAVFWVFSAAALCLFWFIASLIMAAILNVDIGISGPYSTVVFPFIIIISGLFSVNSTRKWLHQSGNLYSLISADLNLKKVKRETYQVTAVKCFKEPQHNGLIYCLRVEPSNQYHNDNNNSQKAKVRVIYDYESQSLDISTQHLLTIKSTLAIITAVHSDVVIENNFSGPESTVISHFDLNIPPAQWPSPDSWLAEDWDTIEAQFTAI